MTKDGSDKREEVEIAFYKAYKAIEAKSHTSNREKMELALQRVIEAGIRLYREFEDFDYADSSYEEAEDHLNGSYREYKEQLDVLRTEFLDKYSTT